MPTTLKTAVVAAASHPDAAPDDDASDAVPNRPYSQASVDRSLRRNTVPISRVQGQ